VTSPCRLSLRQEHDCWGLLWMAGPLNRYLSPSLAAGRSRIRRRLLLRALRRARCEIGPWASTLCPEADSARLLA
jgi:hypothetical protein